MPEKLKAIGVHVFAGGFTRGVIDAGWEVPVQLEAHGFGLETTQTMNGVETINDERADWPDVSDGAIMAFGNPRCTAFSTITSGDRYIENNSHGAFAKQTCDIQQMCEYSVNKFDFVIWESVQQAYKASGRELVDHLVRAVFAPAKYRIAHVFINAATFGNSQQRRRYFFVAYRDCYKFNIQPPVISPYYATLWDAIRDTRGVVGRPVSFRDDDYDADSYLNLGKNEWACVPVLPTGWGLHQLARYGYDQMPEKFQQTWDLRQSDLPFSLHAIFRPPWLRPCPTLHSSASRFIHPKQDRPLTIGELATIMGWPQIPRGPSPVAQIAKGIVPVIGEWLAEQVELSYRGHWGTDDWESSFNDNRGEWDGHDASGLLEKTFDMTRYVGKQFDLERYPAEANDPHERWRTLYEIRTNALRERVR